MKPKLIEPGMKYWLNKTLKECSKFKNKNINIFFNCLTGLLLCLVIGGFLYYKYKGKLTPAEQNIKNTKSKMYILSKLQKLDAMKNAEGRITSLPLTATSYHNTYI